MQLVQETKCFIAWVAREVWDDKLGYLQNTEGGI